MTQREIVYMWYRQNKYVYIRYGKIMFVYIVYGKKFYTEYRQLFLSTLCIQKFPHEIYIKILLPIPYI